MNWLSLVFIIVIGGLLLIYKVRDEQIDDASIMAPGARRVLVVYLLTLGPTLLYLLVAFSALDFPQTPLLPREVSAAIVEQAVPVGVQAKNPSQSAPAPSDSPVPGEQETAPSAAQARGSEQGAVPAPRPTVERIFPLTTMGTAPTVELAIYGREFSNIARVRFDGVDRATRRIDDRLIRATVEPSDLVGKGSITVDVVNPDNQVSNALAVPVDKPTAKVGWLPGDPAVTREIQLGVLVISAGALGSFVHALMSLADFIGNRTLAASWFWWYVSRPFLGMAIAFIFYSLLRGGFLAGTPADASVVNPFGAVAVAALVGMFADKASQKLAEIFDTLFKAEDRRGGKLAGPAIERIQPSTVPVKQATDVILKGQRLGKVTTIRVDSRERKATDQTDHQVTFRLADEDVQVRRALRISVVNMDGEVSPALTLHVSDLAITLASPLQASKDTELTAAPAASGGVPPYKWGLANAPAWLKIDERTAALSGKPPAHGVISDVGVMVTDSVGASATKSFDIEIK